MNWLRQNGPKNKRERERVRERRIHLPSHLSDYLASVYYMGRENVKDLSIGYQPGLAVQVEY